MADLVRARRAKDRLRARLAGTPGVAAVGLAPRGTGYVVKVAVTDEDAAARVPAEVDGVPVVTEPTGPIRPRT